MKTSNQILNEKHLTVECGETVESHTYLVEEAMKEHTLQYLI